MYLFTFNVNVRYIIYIKIIKRLQLKYKNKNKYNKRIILMQQFVFQ